MERAAGGKPLDRGDLGAVLHDDERQARYHPAPVDEHRAGAALAVIAALLGAGQVEPIPQGIEQGRPGRDLEQPFAAVDDEPYRNFVGHRHGSTYWLRRHLFLRMKRSTRLQRYVHAIDYRHWSARSLSTRLEPAF